MTHTMMRLKVQYESLLQQAAAETDTIKLKRLKDLADQVRADFESVSLASDLAGTEMGRAFNARKLRLDEDFSILGLETRMKINKGADLTDVERAEIRQKAREHKEIADREQRGNRIVDEEEAEAEVKERKAEEPADQDLIRQERDLDDLDRLLDKAMDEDDIEGVRQSKEAKKYSKMSEAQKDAEIQQLLQKPLNQENLKKIAVNMATRPGVRVLDDVLERVSKVLPEAVRPKIGRIQITDALALRKPPKPVKPKSELTALLDDVHKEAVKRNSQYAPGLHKIINDLLHYLDTGTLPAKKGAKPDTATEPIRQMQDIVKLLKNELRHSDPAVQERLNEQIKKLEEKIAKGDFEPAKKEVWPESPKTKELKERKKALEAEVKARRQANIKQTDLDTELQTLMMDPESNLEKIVDNLVQHSDVQTADDVVRRVRRQVPEMPRGRILDALARNRRARAAVANENKARMRAIYRWSKRNKTLRSKAEAALRHVQEGTIPTKKPKPGEPPIDANTDLADLVKSLETELRVSDRAQVEWLGEQIAYLKQRLAKGDFGPSPKKVAKTESEYLQRIRYQKWRLENEVHQRLENVKPRSFADKYVWEALRIPMALKASFDESAVGRQGGWNLLTHPIRSAKAIPDTLKATISEEYAFKVMEEILNRPNAHKYHRAGLEFTNMMGPRTQHEEAFRSSLAEKIPGVKLSERGFTVYLNKLRADSFDAALDGFSAAGRTLDLVEEKAIADYINICTGRGAIRSSKFRDKVNFLNGILWSPRFVTSRFQMVTGRAFYGGSWATRKYMAKEYARFLMGAGVMIALGELAGGEFETDPRSSNFGKIRFGDTRLDPFFGLSQTIIFLSRITSGHTKRESGEVVALYGKNKPYGADDMQRVVSRYFRQKLAPAPATLANLAFRENALGEPNTLMSAIKDVALPMSFEDIYKVMIAQGVPRGTALALLGVFGMGLQTYGEEPRSTRRSRRGRSRSR